MQLDSVEGRGRTWAGSSGQHLRDDGIGRREGGAVAARIGFEHASIEPMNTDTSPAAFSVAVDKSGSGATCG
jgi:hypothetical protein